MKMTDVEVLCLFGVIWLVWMHGGASPQQGCWLLAAAGLPQSGSPTTWAEVKGMWSC